MIKTIRGILLGTAADQKFSFFGLIFSQFMKILVIQFPYPENII